MFYLCLVYRLFITQQAKQVKFSDARFLIYSLSTKQEIFLVIFTGFIEYLNIWGKPENQSNPWFLLGFAWSLRFFLLF